MARSLPPFDFAQGGELVEPPKAGQDDEAISHSLIYKCEIASPALQQVQGSEQSRTAKGGVAMTRTKVSRQAQKMRI
jgi:hypothetical protein